MMLDYHAVDSSVPHPLAALASAAISFAYNAENSAVRFFKGWVAPVAEQLAQRTTMPRPGPGGVGPT